VRTTQNTRTGRSIYELDFLPTVVRLGAPKDAVDGKVISAVARDTRLAGFFGSPGLQIYQRFDPEATALFEAMNQPESIWAVHGPREHQIQLGETGWQLSVNTEAMESTSYYPTGCEPAGVLGYCAAIGSSRLRSESRSNPIGV
jgi:hypothetical protein